MSIFRFSRALTLRSIVGLAIGAVGGAALTDLALMASALAFAAYVPSSPQGLAAILGGGLGYGAMRGAFFVLPVAFVVCWPAHLLLMHLGWRNIVAYGLTWAGVTLIAFLVAPYYMGQSTPTWIAAMQLSTGFLAGLLFWLIRRPDRDAISASPQP